jgi:putative addiction module component (TIGR02574 family)
MESEEKPPACDREPAGMEGANDIEDAWYREIERRTSELDAGTAETFPWEIVRARLRAAIC